jgi:hypothetical protein
MGQTVSFCSHPLTTDDVFLFIIAKHDKKWNDLGGEISASEPWLLFFKKESRRFLRAGGSRLS